MKRRSNARVARVWHTAARSPLSKPRSNTEKATEQHGTQRADDGNRTRMTSLEGSRYGGVDQR